MDEQKLKNLISSITRTPTEKIAMTASFRGDLGMDSLQALDLIITLEEDHGIMIGQEHAAKLKTPQELLNFIASMP